MTRTAVASGRAVRRGLAWLHGGVRAGWRDHRLILIVAAVATLPRILAMLAFRPALFITDSFIYMQNAMDYKLGTIRPSGYSAFLIPFRGLPAALTLVTAVQHLMGLAIAVIVYGLLRHWSLPAWGATLAAAPVLFDTREIALESYIVPDTLYALTAMIVLALLLTKRTPRLWQCAAAGLGMAYLTLLRGNGLPLALLAVAFLGIRKVGWRSFSAAAAAFVFPVASYVLAFHGTYGEYNLTSSDGLFLWSRTTSFANCAIIKPPQDLAPLCPDRQPDVSVPVETQPWTIQTLLAGPQPGDYLWAPHAWWMTDAHPGVNASNNALAMRFALMAIEKQPLDYLRVTARDVLLTFLATDRPQSRETNVFTTWPNSFHRPIQELVTEREFAGTTANMHPVYWYAYFMLLYQQPVYFPGVLFLGVLLAGLVIVARDWRRWGGMAALPWSMAAATIITPPLLTQYLYRYAMAAIPLACLAVGLGFARAPKQSHQAIEVNDVEVNDGHEVRHLVPARGEHSAEAKADTALPLA
ncbi:MAG TPA: hypothetical protein VNF47_19860 [Streptosporangiaceae bacterium]|nr:hypothetical protein [Streptosporangiaceae bacterium]